MKNNGCVGCHQLGQLSTRTFPPGLGEFASHAEAWVRRIAVRTVRRADGEHPGRPARRRAVQVLRATGPTGSPRASCRTTKPTRPQGVERNIVVTTWDWGDAEEIPARPDRVGSALSDGQRLRPALRLARILDRRSCRSSIRRRTRSTHLQGAGARCRHAGGARPRPRRERPSRWRLRPTGATRRSGTPRPTTTTPCSTRRAGCGWRRRCAARRTRTSARRAPTIPRPSCSRWSRRTAQLAMLDPKTMKYTFVDTCFQTHHLQFAYDANDTLWTSSGGGGGVVGWVNTKMFDETGDAAKSQGWTALILDTNGNGKRDDYVEPNQPLDPTKDKRIAPGFYAVMPNPVDGSVWGTSARQPRRDRAGRSRLQPAGDRARGNLQRADAGLRPARRRHRQQGRGVGVARERPPRQLRPAQVQGSAQRTEGDRRSLPGGLGVLPVSRAPASTASARTAPSRATTPGSTSTTRSGSARTCRCRPPTSTTAWSRSRTARWSRCACPYPLGFYAKGFDGRIDDPNAGWKGRGLWTTSGDRTPWLMEGGKGTKPMAVHFQLRPDPLAK